MNRIILNLFFFFKQKTAYEMRISDWSSDVCSSDLDDAHHETLVANCIAQGAALMTGRASEDGARNYPSDRPSTTILLDQVTPRSLGALIAFYEHRVFANAVLLGINPFDQFGVELGKEMRSEEHTSELQSLMRTSYAVFCLKKKKINQNT